MITYVNTVFVSNDGAIATSLDNLTKEDKGKFVLYDIDQNKCGLDNKTQRFKIGMVTGKTVKDHNGESHAIIKWSNIIQTADIKSLSTLEYKEDSEDTIKIDFSAIDPGLFQETLSTAGKRIIVRLTFKDLPTRYRKWTESYEYVTKDGDTKQTIVTGIANLINREYKRARVQATAEGTKLTLVALPYDDDNSVDSLNWANKVRFNANIYWTDPAAEGWESLNKHFPNGVSIEKTPGKQYPASANLVRDRESWAMGYQGILNRGEGTWPIIKPAMETSLDNHYDGITLEFENMYRAADDIQRKTKQTLEVYATTGTLKDLKGILASFVAGEAVQASATANQAANAASAADLEALAGRVSALENAGSEQP